MGQEANSDGLRGRGTRIARRWLVVAILPLVMGGLMLTPGPSWATAQPHYRAVFVAESSLPVTGKAEIQVDANGVAHMVIHVSGLLPGETFPAHIHEGATIEEPGPILVALPDLVANPGGKATQVATLPGAGALELGKRTIGVHLADGTRIAKGAIE